jgi:hypothetical protein
VEAALAVATLLFVLVLCLGGLAAVGAQVRCIDAAREAARLAARGDDTSASAAAAAIAPSGAVLLVRRDGEFVVATVSVETALLHGLRITADATAAMEPGA